VRTVQRGPLVGLAGGTVLLGVLAVSVGLSPLGWACGLGGTVVLVAALSAALDRTSAALGPADQITLARAVIACGVAALVASAAAGAGRIALVTLAAVALVLDNVDGRVARRTGTTSELGARFDLEVDAFLILVLSIDVSRTSGAWVLTIGAARYLFVVARRILPWMRAPLPPRYWCKVVAAVQGVVLTVAAARLLPGPVAGAALVVALALLAESFGRELWWLWRSRPVPGRRRPVWGWAVSLLAGLLAWAALVAPDLGTHLSPAALASAS